FSSRRRHTRFSRDWSSDVCSSDLSLLLFFHPGFSYLNVLQATARRVPMFLQHQHFDRNQTLYWLKTQIRPNLLNLIFFLPFLTINFDYQRYINYTESLFL